VSAHMENRCPPTRNNVVRLHGEPLSAYKEFSLSLDIRSALDQYSCYSHAMAQEPVPVNEAVTLLKVALTKELEKVNAALTALEALEATRRQTDRASGREILEEEDDDEPGMSVRGEDPNNANLAI
jgi:hypothetical protein